MASENPYATPASADQPAPTHGWSVQGDTVLMETSAQLPPVDPYTGETGDHLIPATLTIKPVPAVTFVIQIIASLGFLAFTYIDSPPMRLAVMGIAATINIVIAARVHRSGFCRLNIAQTPASRRRILFWRMFVVALLVAFIIFFASQFERFGNPMLLIVPSIALFGAIALARHFTPKLVCRRKIGPHYEIRGFHPLALELLRDTKPDQAN